MPTGTHDAVVEGGHPAVDAAAGIELVHDLSV